MKILQCAMLGAATVLCAARASANVLDVPGDYRSIQAAIDAAQPEDIVLVAPGTYHETITIPHKSYLTVESSGGADVTIIDGDGAAAVVTFINVPHTVRFAGFTIRNGVIGLYAPNVLNDIAIDDCVVRDCTGPAAVDMGGNAHPVLTRCTVTENAGLGIRTLPGINTMKALAIKDSVISHNGAGGVAGKWISLDGCTIEANTGIGAALDVQTSLQYCVVIGNTGTGATGRNAFGCVFADNGGWGLDAAGVGTSAQRCSFLGNASGGLRMVAGDSGGTGPANFVLRCLFANGDGVWSQAQNFSFPGGYTLFESCTFDGGSGITINKGALIIRDSILRGMSINTSKSKTITYSNVQGGAAGLGNIDADPLWADTGNDDYALLPGSPCINTGDPNYDLDPDGSLVEMGSVPYEAWVELGTGLAGLSGVAQLAGTGSLVGGTPVALALTGAPGSTPITLLLGASQLGAPFKGGTLWPVPLLAFAGLPTDASGSLTLGGTWPAGLPAGTSLWAQCWWSDAGGPLGFASSNGVRGTQP